MPHFPSRLPSSSLRAFSAGDYGRVVGASLPENGADGMARRKDETTIGRKVEPRLPAEMVARPAVPRPRCPFVEGSGLRTGFLAKISPRKKLNAAADLAGVPPVHDPEIGTPRKDGGDAAERRAPVS